MKLHGVLNASPDSLADFSIVNTPDEAVQRGELLLSQGCVGLDIGGAGSTQFAERVDVETEWARLDGKVQALAELCATHSATLSVDTWQPEVMRRAVEAGATMFNAADGMQHPDMLQLATNVDLPIVLPFVAGVDPKASQYVKGDPLEAISDYFKSALVRCDQVEISRDRLILDPGTGFGPADWEWEDRYLYQKHIYSNLEQLKSFGLPIYVSLPWKETDQHDELMEIVLRSGIDYGRCHQPLRVLQTHKRLAGELGWRA